MNSSFKESVIASLILILVFAVALFGMGYIALHGHDRDPCRIEMEEAWTAYQAGDMDVARDRLENAVGATCLTEIE